MRVIFWIALAAMASVYAVMLLWSLPKLSAFSGGAIMFDLRPFGYGYEHAQDILRMLGADGRDFYQRVQHRLDTAYPALLGVVLVLSYWRLYSRRWAVRFAFFAIFGAGFDYLENAAVATMLKVGPDGLTHAMVEQASRWSQAKSITIAIALTLLVVGLIRAGWGRWKPGR